MYWYVDVLCRSPRFVVVVTENFSVIECSSVLQRMFIRTCFSNHQYCQPLPHFRPVSSNGQAIRHLSTAQETNFDKEELSNYRPISNLVSHFKNNRLERVVKSRLMDHLTSNSLLNSHQSADCKHHCDACWQNTNDYLINWTHRWRLSEVLCKNFIKLNNYV